MSIVASVSLKEVCYNRLGCFSNDTPFAWTLQRPIPRLPWSPETINARFLLYTRDNLRTYQEISAVKPETIKTSFFRKTKETRFIIHGFTDSGEAEWLSDMCKAMLQVEDVNCICVDWQGGSVALYTQASNNIRVVGAEVAYFVKTLKDIFNYLPSNVHLIGHSLGAHTAGEAGKRLPGIGRITGLDPAQPYFQDTPIEVRLDPSDALFVDVIHTDSSLLLLNLGYGISQNVGHLNFFPNGGKQMSGCQKSKIFVSPNIDDILDVTSKLVACNHIRSHEYYTHTILTPDGFLGYLAASYNAFQQGAGFPCPSKGCPMMGHYAVKYSGITSVPQTFYLNTGDLKDFPRWRYRITVYTFGSLVVFGSFFLSLEGANGKTKDYTLYRGLITTGTSYTAFIDAEINVGQISKVTFVWNGSKLVRLGASSVTVQSGKDGATYVFCSSASVSPGTPQILSLC
ncbi:pancreatic lipase-related protein 2-like [Rana temporaria]|uniref:pancreatic lipase-related protein 2-like n=1 Tax=Rana temporaria TaxID=8407 RepID=UPI001AAC4D8D|nr:pancreatic lipase-related protein 2-like [Rana temporaria]